MNSHDTVAWNWATKQRPAMKGASMFFEGDTIYSYGHHWPLAKHMDGFVLVNSDRFSVSTSQHLSIVRRSIHGRAISYDVHPGYWCHATDPAAAAHYAEVTRQDRIREAEEERERKKQYRIDDYARRRGLIERTLGVILEGLPMATTDFLGEALWGPSTKWTHWTTFAKRSAESDPDLAAGIKAAFDRDPDLATKPRKLRLLVNAYQQLLAA